MVRGVAPDASVAIHRPRLTTFVKGLGIVDINTATNPRAAMALDLANRRTRDYLSEMGMPDALYAAMLATPIDPVRTLDAGELAAFHLTGIDPEYREIRAGEAARKYGITPEEFGLRTSRMPEQCLAEKAPVREIVLCYRRVLQIGG